jgi:glycerol-3-phosphate dehydrogenase
VSERNAINVDVVIFGGGAAGLWILDEAVRAGHSALLLEAGLLGGGQTIASQGIIHGGLKYALHGWLNPSAAAVREMPALWRDCLAGRREPKLTKTRVLAEHCCLWRTRCLLSRAGLLGARFGLRVRPVRLPRGEWPPALNGCPGEVFQLGEPVISAESLLSDLASRHLDRLLRIEARYGLHLEVAAGHRVREISLIAPAEEAPAPRPERPGGGTGGTAVAAPPREALRVALRPAVVVLAAGEGNAALRVSLGLAESAMQRRPLHMVMVRGRLPVLYGHCADGAATRVTITTHADAAGRTVWQVGGQVAEAGARMERGALIEHARRELSSVLPGVDLADMEWASYRIDRAEAATRGGRRPRDATILQDGNVLTVWPTKLALVPRLAERVCERLGPAAGGSLRSELLETWPRPAVASPPWEQEQTWSRAS